MPYDDNSLLFLWFAGVALVGAVALLLWFLGELRSLCSARSILIATLLVGCAMYVGLSWSPWQKTRSFLGHTNPIQSVSFAPNGERIATSSKDGTVRIFDAKTGARLLVIRGHPGGATAASFSPDGLKLVTGGADGSARVWNAESGEELIELKGHRDGVMSAQFMADGEHVLTMDNVHIPYIWTINWDASPVVAQRAVAMRGLGKGELVWTFSANGQLMLTEGPDKVLHVRITDNGQEVAHMTGSSKGVLFAAFSPDGRKVVTTGVDEFVAHIWDADTETETAVLRGHANIISQAAFSGDGQFLATAGYDFTTRIWDVERAKEVVKLSSYVRALTFAPDGLKFVTADFENTASLWERQRSEKKLDWIPFRLTILLAFLLAYSFYRDVMEGREQKGKK